VTLTPALGMLLIRGRIRKEEENPVSRFLIRLYQPFAEFSLRRPKLIIAATALLIAATVPVALRLGSEFMPPLNEGSVLYMPTSVPGMGMDEAVSALQRQDALLKTIPEVKSVFGKAGRAETSTDPAPVNMFETVIELQPKEQWRDGMTFEKLLAEMDELLTIPGMPNTFWMPIQTRTEMLATGVRSAVAVKLFGDDLESLEQAAVAVEGALTDVPGTRNAFAERLGQGHYLDIEVDRLAAARYGLTVGDVTDVIETALGGSTVSRTVEGRERYPVTVRYARDFRNDPEKLGDILVATPMGGQIPLGALVTVTFQSGPPMIQSENAKLSTVVLVNVDAGVPVGDYVPQAREALAEKVTLPPGVRLEWAGQYEYMERAADRLKIVVPLTLLIVFTLIYLNSKSVTETLIVLLAVPFSLVGAFWLLWVLDYNMSVAVWVGLIALAGLDAETGIVMLVYLDHAYRDARARSELHSEADLKQAILHGAVQRIRPKAMTVLTILFGLLPIMWSTGTGADVMKRIAAPMVGGITTSALLELLVYPAIYLLWKKRGLEKQV
jgi:Cu(I)/Ag(I) efflux system membrane protein CusA/SilA